ncbi:MAG: exodeoxyribonuclease V subunit gamma [Actinomycetota bacterium]|nr:exodeoxyribonuclease V subunit gamma [Actinomycetota bacterium]
MGERVTLALHRSERADALVAGLAELLTATPGDPFTPDVVAVPSKGVERWISQSLSVNLGADEGRANGICANVVFPSPARLVREAVAATAGIEPDEDPWAEDLLTWSIVEVIDDCAGEDWCITLGRHLGLVGGAIEQGRRIGVAQKLASLFTSYGAQRPTMLRDWARDDSTDGFGSRLDADLAWQAELWRRVRGAIGVDSPAERIDASCGRLRDDPGLVDLPERLSLFGPTRLTTDQLQVCDALAEHRDVHLWLPHPSHGSWDRVGASDDHVGRRADDDTADLPQHPLVSSCGRDAREMQLRLAEHTHPAVDEYRAQPIEASSLLATMQRDIHDDRTPDAGLRLRRDDRSVQVHACHGRQRQVEVLREVLLGMLEDDPMLELRDVIVMCPDIESYAPLVSAAFGLADGEVEDLHPGHSLKVRLADRSLRQTNPVLTVVARLLDLADSRLTVSEVLDLAAMPPVRARFGFDDEALERVGDWVRRSGVRWGLDAEARAPYQLEKTPQNTWRAGIDRLLLGTAMDEDGLRTVGLVLPLDDVDSNEVDLAGRLAEFADRLGTAVNALTMQKPLTAWVRALASVVEDFTDVSPRDEWQVTQAQQQLTGALTSAGSRADTVALGLSDVRALLGSRLEGRPTRANFRTGHLTMCTMVPMRSVPHRVLCLLGLDDGVFPRGSHADGDDALARSPRVGERDPRSEDRQLFLDALLAARERLVVFFTGADERTGAERPPAVPLGELLDVLDRTATTQSGTVRDHVLVRHPLQPFDERNFVAGSLGGEDPLSFDEASYDGALALRGEQPKPGLFLSQPLSDNEPVDLVELDALVRFLEHPVKSFLRQRLGITTLEGEEEPAGELPVALDKLEEWAVGDRLLTAGLSGIHRDQAVQAEWLRGDLPPGQLGAAIVDPIADHVASLVRDSAGLRSGFPEAVDVALDLDSGIRLAGTVPAVYGDRVVRVVYSKLGAKHRLRAWVYLLALVAANPERDWTAVTVGRARSGTATATLSTPTHEQALAELASLTDLYLAGRREPLPFAAKTSHAYASKRLKGSAAMASEGRAALEWRKSFDGRDIGDFNDAEHRRVWGGDAPFSALLAEPARPGEPWAEEPHRFGQLACRVWAHLLASETVVS